MPDALSSSHNERTISSYIIRHWQGQQSLIDAIWKNTVLLNIAICGLPNLGLKLDIQALDPLTAIFAYLALILASLLISVWQVVGVWRSAKAMRKEQKKANFWSFFWQGFCIVYAVNVLVLVAIVLIQMVSGLVRY